MWSLWKETLLFLIVQIIILFEKVDPGLNFWKSIKNVLSRLTFFFNVLIRKFQDILLKSVQIYKENFKI